jgi:hypothetical protein
LFFGFFASQAREKAEVRSEKAEDGIECPILNIQCPTFNPPKPGPQITTFWGLRCATEIFL